jgi:nucleoside-diphosphate-sugar epimerase
MDGYDVYNAGGGRPVSVNEIADMIGGKDYPRKHLPPVPEPRETKASGIKVKLKTGWSPKVKIEDGLAALKPN